MVTWAHSPVEPHAVVLYADDDLNDLFFVQRAFTRRRPELQLCAVDNGQEIIDYLTAAVKHDDAWPYPQLVILDIDMPFPDGFDVLIWIRSHPQLSELPVIILSSSVRPSDRQRASDLGATGYIVKTASFSDLPDVMSPWLPPATDSEPAGPPGVARWPLDPFPAN